MTEERRDDEILGRALGRAIETIDLNETPFEASRLALAPRRRFTFGAGQLLGVATAALVVFAIGSWLARPTDDAAGPVGASASPSTGPQASASPVAVVPNQDRFWVFFARDSLPPLAAEIRGTSSGNRVESEILSRISALHSLSAKDIPAGASNPLAKTAPSATAGQTLFGIGAQVEGDLATVEFEVPTGWGVHGAAESTALVQQLVYVITEEPGIRRAMITEKGKAKATIDQLVIDRPLSREDVSGYTTAASTDTVSSDGGTGGRLSYTVSTDKLAAGLTRFVVTSASADVPRFSVSTTKWNGATPNDAGKQLLTVQVLGASDKPGLETYDGTPLRGVMTTVDPKTGFATSVTTFDVRLDDLRPWRVFTLKNPTRIVVDIGGVPQAVSDRIAVYSPAPRATVTHDLAVSGVARVFEANVVWRVKDQSGKSVANGHFLASLGSSALWGTFDAHIAIPASVRGNVTLELYEASPKDGSEQGLVAIPLSVP
jgi:hypothetical protein